MKRLRKKSETATILKADGWQNALTGWGTARDKTAYSYFARDRKLTFPEIESLYHFDALSGRIVDVPVLEMFKKGYEIHVENDSKAEKNLQKQGQKLQKK